MAKPKTERHSKQNFYISKAVKKHYIILSAIAVLLIFSAVLFITRTKNKTAQPQEPWHEYIEEEHNARIYIQHADQNIAIVACLSIAGIDCSIHLNHTCSTEQFSRVQDILLQNKATYKGTVSQPDTTDYPDLTDYLPLVMSSDEMHEMWAQLGLE